MRLPDIADLPPGSTPRTGRASRRESIYAHPSIRALPISGARIGAGLIFAALMRIASVLYAVPIMEAHANVASVIAGWAGLPITGWSPVSIFPGLEPASAPELVIPAFREVNEDARLVLILSIVVLLIVARRFSLFRNLANFLIVLLLASGVANAFFDRFRLSSVTFGQIWLRQEMLVWLLLPWVLLLLFVFPQANLLQGILWVGFLQAYGLIFSALRMVLAWRRR